MTTPEPPRDDDRSAPVGLTRSSVWRRTVTAASLIGTGVVTKLLGDMMVKSLTEDSFLAHLGRALSGLWLGLLALAAAFALYRWFETRREQARVAREVELLEQLVPPGPNIEPPPHDCPGSAPAPDLTGRAEATLEVERVLRALPFQEYEAAALLAIVAAVAEIPMKTPGARAAEPMAARLLLRELSESRVIHLGGRQGYCVDRRPARGALPDCTGAVSDSRAWRVGISVLLHHWADLAGLWALGLNHRELADGARRWFAYRDGYLDQLVAAAVAAGSALPRDAVPAAARLVDALDVWAALLGRPRYEATGWLHGRLSDPRLAWARAGRLNERPRYRSRFALASGQRARELHHAALTDLTRIARQTRLGPARFDPVVRKLTRTWWRLPRTDTAGEVCTAIDLAVVHLVQGRFDAAADRLDLAESLARRGDPGGMAHAAEIRGVLFWARGEARRALIAWNQALESYRGLADHVGAGRCQQHIGSALIVAPQHAGALSETELAHAAILEQSRRRLRDALELHPGALYARRYHRAAGRRLAGLR
ncbi:hypothetical protein ACFVMC_18745 [Nocardia sp. NPDC127579]|uniref:hypothetical protein n=1 Tax=Nocardia sp. NPDC127579 TaxID=3345402 RepID=UPI0036413A7E